ncbi:hypothetical protein [Butyricimonas virosa]|jgi:hypothetical protein|uniref:hypothetical protein n=1 Tax=Butyricimonas virosa TaxID=544645 RepID=UPI00241D82A5|nr:hypothetical protein [Butyricimonas virosa]
MRYNDLSLMQNYTYKGWSVLLNGKSPLFSNSYEFHVTINFCKDIVDSIFMPIVQKQNLSKGEEVILMCKISACPNSNFASYRINIKKKLLNFNLSDAPYVREAIQQVNRNIDSNLGDAITYIQSHSNEIEKKLQLLLY